MINKRRALLTALTGAALMPRRWQRPVVSSVILPAHAMTTDDVICDPLRFGQVTADCTTAPHLLTISVNEDEECPRLVVRDSTGEGFPQDGMIVATSTVSPETFLIQLFTPTGVSIAVARGATSVCEGLPGPPPNFVHGPRRCGVCTRKFGRRLYGSVRGCRSSG